MKAYCILALLVLVFQATLGEKRYDGYKLLRIHVSDTTQYNEIALLAEEVLADIWATNAIEGWVDVMVSPSQSQTFLGKFDAQIHIEDVQVTLDQHKEDMMNKSIVRDDIFDSFPTSGAAKTWVLEQVAAHSDVASSVVIGQTTAGIDIFGIRLGQTGAKKPTLYLHCTIHAREWITTTTCLWIIDSLLNTDPDGSRLINFFEWIIIPIFNIDGYDYAHTTDRLWRKNRSTNSGSSCRGIDLNRNYGYGFGGPGSSNNPCAETFRGTAAFSSWEVSAERDFLEPILGAGNLVAFVDIHSYGAYFMSPWGYTTNLPPAVDYNVMERVMISATTAIRTVNNRNYVYGSSARVIYVAAGGSDDWTYGDGGVVRSFTIEAYGSNFTPPISFIPVIGRELWAGIKKLALDLIN